MGGVRTTEQRKADALAKLAESDADLWVATASATGEPYLVPLSYAWDGVDVILSTHSSTLTARNLAESGRARLGIGHTRDVVMIDAHVVDTVSISDAPSEIDRKSVVSGQSVSLRVVLGGRRIIKKNKHNT